MSHKEMLILVPGVNLDGRLFEAQRPVLETSHDLMIADNHSADTMAMLAGKLLERAPERFAIAGLSMGGYIALEVMRQAPERVTRLALLDTNARADNDEARERRARMIALAEGGGFEKTHAMLWERLVHPAHQTDRELEGKVLEMMRATGPEAFVRQQQAIMGRMDLRPHLGKIAVPTLVLVGQQDAMTPPEQADEMAGLIPQARLVKVADCGHLSTMEQPQAVTEAMQAWLRA